MKKIYDILPTIAVAVSLLLGTACFAETVYEASRPRPPRIEIRLSSEEWRYVKGNVDTNGYCTLESQNVYIVITNGIGHIDVSHLFPIGRGPERKSKNRKPNPNEPIPYGEQWLFWAGK